MSPKRIALNRIVRGLGIAPAAAAELGPAAADRPWSLGDGGLQVLFQSSIITWAC